MKIKKIISAIICAAMCLSVFAINTSAVSNSDIEIIKKEFDKKEAYDYYISHQNDTNNMIISNNARGTSAPTTFWRLDDENYIYSGSVTETKGATLYTSCYFLPTTDGKLYIEGYASVDPPAYNQDMQIYLRDMTANTTKIVTLGENEKIHDPVVDGGTFTLYYYNFAFINLDPTHFYYLYFNTKTTETYYSVSGIIAHNWTNEIRPDM